MLTQFRSYPFLSLQTDTRNVVLTGPNGAGKTNILEALSFFTPGRGMRNARLNEVSTHPGLEEKSYLIQPWSVSMTYTTEDQGYHIGTGIQIADGKEKRVLQVDGEPLKNQGQLAEYLNILWITPQMDRLFAEGSTARRRFFDRLVSGFDTQHMMRLNRYDYFMRERNNLLQQHRYDPGWILALEQKMSGEAVAIAASRNWVLNQLQQQEVWLSDCFPAPLLSLEGALEELLLTHKALEAEEMYCSQLQDNRARDQAAGRTLEGVHRTDLKVIYRDKGMEAAYCSTGEQKALLIAIIMATARLQAEIKKVPPVLLLDEIAAHLDETRRHALFEEIIALGMQAWLTGTENEIFSPFGSHIQYFQVENSIVKPL